MKHTTQQIRDTCDVKDELVAVSTNSRHHLQQKKLGIQKRNTLSGFGEDNKGKGVFLSVAAKVAEAENKDIK